MGYGGMGYGGMGYGGMGYGGMGYGMGYGSPLSISPSGNTTPPATTTASGTTGTDLTGRYLGSATGSAQSAMARIPHVIPNPFDNTLLVQGTPQEWEQIKQLLEQLDIPPRQVLIEAKIYEVDLTGQFQGGVESYLQKLGESFSSATGGSGSSGTGSGSGSSGGSVTVPFTRSLLGAASGSGLQLSSGFLVGHSRELLAVLTAQEQTTRAKVIAAPSVMATDSIPASIQVGASVPTLSSQAVSGVQSGGSSLLNNTISNQRTGV